MIKVYYLETQRIDNTDTIKGTDYIHNAILQQEDTLRKLIQDTTDNEHTSLLAACVTSRAATNDEIAQLQAFLATIPPPPDQHPFTPVSRPPDLPGAVQRLNYIETFLKIIYP